MQPTVITPSDFGYYQIYSQPTSVQQAKPSVEGSPFDITFLILLLGFISLITWHKKRRFNPHAIEKQRKRLERIWELSSTK